jgi:hypothetical protein
MNAAKISHTVEFEKPPSAQAIDFSGVPSTIMEAHAKLTPIKPTAAAGTGSTISPVTTAEKSEKKYHALGVNPDG